MKKTILAFSALVLIGLTACGGKDKNESSTGTDEAAQSETTIDNRSESDDNTLSPSVSSGSYSSDDDNSDVSEIEVEEVEEVSDNSSSSSDSANADKWLNDYEKMMNKYVSLVKKSKSDPSLVAEYTELLSEMNDLNSKIGGLDLSAAQTARFAKIQAKAAAAMQ